jgi:hypothetical protein
MMHLLQLRSLDAQVAAECRERCADLLSRHPLYPRIQL